MRQDGHVTFGGQIKRGGQARWIVVTLACLSWIVPCGPAAAESPKRPLALRTTALDVSLQQGGRLVGQVVNSKGKPMQGQIVLVLQGQREVGRTACSLDGAFSLKGLRGGVYQVAVGDTVRLCRCWVHRTAPPAANDQLLLITDSDVTRGQQPIKRLVNPLLLGILIAGAVAIPIAVRNSKNDRPSGS